MALHNHAGVPVGRARPRNHHLSLNFDRHEDLLSLLQSNVSPGQFGLSQMDDYLSILVKRSNVIGRFLKRRGPATSTGQAKLSQAKQMSRLKRRLSLRAKLVCSKMNLDRDRIRTRCHFETTQRFTQEMSAWSATILLQRLWWCRNL
jgi:hypothetical protein